METGQFDIAVVEGHCKASNILYPAHIEAFALDPLYGRPLGFHPSFVAGMEMRAFLESTGNTQEQAALVVAKNRANAFRNPLAAYPANLSAEEVLQSRPLAEPLKEGEVARYADGAIVLVLAREGGCEATSRKAGIHKWHRLEPTHPQPGRAGVAPGSVCGAGLPDGISTWRA